MDQLKAQLKRHEGLRLKPYKCSAGKLTIGYGRNLEDVGISEREAEYLLERDIDKAVADLSRAFDWFGRLDSVRQDVVINMTFNIGLTRLFGFRRMIAALDRGDFNSAADEMLDSKWARQVKGRAKELSRQMKLGEYT